jgi:hypothetical protein
MQSVFHMISKNHFSKAQHLKHLHLALLILIFPVKLFAQKDVTQFLGIPIDGYKPEMIKKLKEKGFKSSPTNKEILIGEFNGSDVDIHIVTNNNKVCRIMVADAVNSSEGDSKIRVNKLCQQFHSNTRYISISDSAISKYYISESEDISFEMSVNQKRYEAVFFQKPADYDSLDSEKTNILNKDTLSNADNDRLLSIVVNMVDSKNFKKIVWFKINEIYGKYYIAIYYDNEYNRANGDDL